MRRPLGEVVSSPGSNKPASNAVSEAELYSALVSCSSKHNKLMREAVMGQGECIFLTHFGPSRLDCTGSANEFFSRDFRPIPWLFVPRFKLLFILIENLEIWRYPLETIIEQRWSDNSKVTASDQVNFKFQGSVCFFFQFDYSHDHLINLKQISRLNFTEVSGIISEMISNWLSHVSICLREFREFSSAKEAMVIQLRMDYNFPFCLSLLLFCCFSRLLLLPSISPKKT